MKLVQLALSACLAAGTMTMMSVPASAEGGYGRHGGGHGGHGGHVSRYRGGHGSVYAGRYRGGHRGRGNGGAFIAGAVVGSLLGWSGGYGYPRAHYQRYQSYHRPYYAPQRHHYNGHTRPYYSYSDGYDGGRQGYQSYGNAGCHPVFKFGHWNGRPAKVGGTMCYNRHGGSFVVSGSRYLIHYR